MVTVLIYRLRKNAALPSYQTSGASGMDLSACTENPIQLKPGQSTRIPTGLQIAIPKGYEGQVRPTLRVGL